MQFPCPTLERKFKNDYDVWVCAVSLLLRRIATEDNIFAALCISRLASIIQYTEILKFHLQYNIFPSDCIRDCIVTPSLSQINEGTLV